MNKVVALLVGVSIYNDNDTPNLKLVVNDLEIMKEALMSGLCIPESNIFVYGQNGKVKKDELLIALKNISDIVDDNDIFIFYFSGHGNKDFIAVTDGIISYATLLQEIDKYQVRNRILFIDSCHSGVVQVSPNIAVDYQKSLDSIIGNGSAVFSSCRVDEESGFDKKRKVSIFTGALADAIRYPTIKEGFVYLEDIIEVTRLIMKIRLQEKDNRKLNQLPVFTSSINGTVYFKVGDYHPYIVKTYRKEMDDYFIYEVLPVHVISAKRFVVNVILKHKSSKDQIIQYTKEIVNELYDNDDIFQTAEAEDYYKGKMVNVIWCHFYYSFNDLDDSNLICVSTWADDEHKESYYDEDEQSIVIDDICLKNFGSYEEDRNNNGYSDYDESNDLRIKKQAHDLVLSAINRANVYMQDFHDYENGTISKSEFVKRTMEFKELADSLDDEIEQLSPKTHETKELLNRYVEIVQDIRGFAIYFDVRNEEKWTDANKAWLLQHDVHIYNADLKNIKDMSESNMDDCYEE